MRLLSELIDNNRKWADDSTGSDPNYFARLAEVQKPEFLWIGCADSRVPANQVVGLAPGEVFVHRNIANVVAHIDLNCLSVMEYAVAVLKVKHVIVCGHYGCGGVKAASQGGRIGLIDNWLRHIRDVRQQHHAELAGIHDEQARFDRLCELNVIQQVRNVCSTSVVQEAWDRHQSLSVHGWIYSLADGLVKDLEASITGPQDVAEAYRLAENPLA